MTRYSFHDPLAAAYAMRQLGARVCAMYTSRAVGRDIVQQVTLTQILDAARDEFLSRPSFWKNIHVHPASSAIFETMDAARKESMKRLGLWPQESEAA